MKSAVVTAVFALLALFAVTELADAGRMLVHAATAPAARLLGN